MKNVFSIDVEDWYHILELESTPETVLWDSLESRVEMNFTKMLDEFDQTNTKVTCFFLGWVAEKHPEIVKEAYKRGHEISSHGYAHQLVYTQNEDKFFKDVKKTKDILENIIGSRVIGYRSPGFSITKNTLWAFDSLVKAGYKYDSSIFPTSRTHGGIKDAYLFPHKICTGSGTIIEFPISVVNILRNRICFFGGGYLRLFPLSVINKMTKIVNKENRPVIYYIHPREIDIDHPRLSMGILRYLKSYINLNSTMPKLKYLTRKYRFTTINNWVQNNKNLIEVLITIN